MDTGLRPTNGTRGAETEIARTQLPGIRDTIRGTYAGGFVSETAAAINLLAGIDGLTEAGRRRHRFGVVAGSIQAPLPDIAMDVMQAEAVGFELSDGSVEFPDP
jgi:hypothetical protein